LGTVQMFLMLTIIYWTLLASIAIPMKVFSDPLGLKRKPSQWVEPHNSLSRDNLRDQG